MEIEDVVPFHRWIAVATPNDVHISDVFDIE